MNITEKERRANSIKVRAMMRKSARLSRKNGDNFDTMVSKIDEIKDANWDRCFGSMLNDQRGKIILSF